MPNQNETVWKSGDSLATCEICGFTFYRSELRYNWKKQLVCQEDWEPRHPQLDVKAKIDRINAPDGRPEPTDTFLGKNEAVRDNL